MSAADSRQPGGGGADYRYGPWQGGPDPLAPPYDLGEAMDALGDAVLDGADPRSALDELLRRGQGGRGLDDLLRQVRDRQRSARMRGRLDQTLDELRSLLDKAIGEERAALFPDPSDDARLREAELDTLPSDTARAVRALSDYQWRSPQAAQTYQEIRDRLRRDVLDTQFRGMRQALESTSPEDVARVRDMMADLNAMLAADDRGEHSQADFDAFMAKHGEFFPDNPANLEELVDSLARRAAAAQRMLQSMTPEQREELANLMSAALGDMGLQLEMDQLGQALRNRRPDLDWLGRERMRGRDPMSVGDAVDTLEELDQLAELEAALGQDYPGASLEDVDPELVEAALGRAAVDDLERLRAIERELERAGYLQRVEGRLELTPRAIRRIGQTALRRVFASLRSAGTGEHDVAGAGPAGELTGASRQWRFGDEQPLDVVRTVRNAVLRAGPVSRQDPVQLRGPGRGVRLAVEDFEVVETERRTSAAVSLLVDLSYSMELRGTWGTAKTTALALQALVSSAFPHDALQIVGFSRYARELRAAELPGLSWDMVQGTNLQHALMLAGRHLRRHPQAEPVVLVVTDGEPTAHLLPDGDVIFDWPPQPETLALTMAEVEKLTRYGATINVFMLDDEPRLLSFVERLAQRNGGRVFAPAADRLGDYVISDYLRARRGGRGSAR